MQSDGYYPVLLLPPSASSLCLLIMLFSVFSEARHFQRVNEMRFSKYR